MDRFIPINDQEKLYMERANMYELRKQYQQAIHSMRAKIEQLDGGIDAITRNFILTCAHNGVIRRGTNYKCIYCRETINKYNLPKRHTIYDNYPSYVSPQN